ncbi:MAG TPA: SDR family NAD(P)-dependent oxidoreductase [Bacillota bacterium]|nr:SDR family NAD(P)-dependent oxidoreductase [Bacillota bacterium]
MELIKNYIYSQVAAKNLAPEEALKLLKEIFEAGLTPGQSHDVAIIGLACRFPGADNKEEFWQLLEQGISRIRNFPPSRRCDTDQFLKGFGFEGEDPYKLGGYLDKIDEFDAAFFRIPPKEAELMEPAQRIFLETAWEAIEDAGLGGNRICGSRTGIYIGKDTSRSSDYGKLITENNPLISTGLTTSILASRLAYILNLKGPCPVVDTACSSSMVALHMAYRGVVDGEVDMAIAGGVALSFIPVEGSNMIDSQDGKLCAFDKRADGTVWGEGFGVIVLKPLKLALRDQNHIYAVIKGSAINNDGTSNGLTAPSAEAQADVIEQALKRAKVDPETITYIEAHGTGTKLGDPIEIQGIQLAFSRYTAKKQFCGIGTVKTSIGHLVGASGLAGLIKMALALQNRKLPASINFNEPNPFINFIDSPVYLNARLRDWKSEGNPRRCGISSFGFSGTNCHVILEEAPDTETPSLKCRQRHIFTLSAKTEASFRRLLEKYIEFLNGNCGLELGALCYTVTTGRGHYVYRLAVICGSLLELSEKLTQIAVSMLEDFNPAIPGGMNPGVFFGKHVVVVQQKQKAPDEIFEGDKIVLSEAANQLLQQKLDNGDITSGLDETGLTEICQYYIQGADIAWELLYPAGAYPTLSLPTYPFDRKRYWVEGDLSQIMGGFGNSNVNPLDTDFYHNTTWTPEPLNPGGIIRETGVLLLNDSSGMGENIALLLKNSQQKVIIADLGNEFQKIKGDRYTISGSQADYEQLFREIQGENISLILHLHSLTAEKDIRELEQLNRSQKRGVWSLYYLTRAIFKSQLSHDLRLILISEFVNEVTRNESRIIPENATLFGLGKVVGMEYSNLKLRGLDIDETTTAEEILRELAAVNYTFVTAYRAGERYVEVFTKIQISEFESSPIPIHNHGVYIITGGAGGIGLEMGKYLASQNRVNLAFINRTKLPERSDWETIITRDKNGKLAKKLQGIQAIEQNGSQVVSYSADVSNQDQMAPIIDELRTKYGKINGIIHSAGVVGDGFIIRKEEDVFQKVLAPKVQGTWILDQLTQDDHLDFLVLFSSVATLLAGGGQGDYTAANAYLDSFAAYRGKQEKKTLTINWPTWKETGMAVDYGVTQDSIFKALGTARAIACFTEVLNSSLSKAIIGALNYRSPGMQILNEAPQSLYRVSEEIKTSAANWRQHRLRPVAAKSPGDFEVRILGKQDGTYTETETKLARLWGEVLGVHEINIYDNFYELGGDSILAIQIINRLNEDLSRKSHIGDLFEHGTILAFASFLDGQVQNQNGNQEPQISLSVGEAAEYDLSDLQQGIWLIQSSYPEMTGYNIPIGFQVNAPDLNQLKMALELLIKRQAVLRTIFREKDGIPKQIILESIPITLEVTDLSTKENNEELLAALLLDKSQQVIDITQPLKKVELFKLTPEKYYLMILLHHISIDAWSTVIFVNEFMQIYNNCCNGTTPYLEPLKFRYVDWVNWQNKWLESEESHEVEDYWLRELTKPLPVLNLPTDYERPAVQTFRGANLRLKIDRAETRELKALSRKWNITLHTLFCAAYFVLLHKITTDRDLTIGVPLAGRDAKELENIVGLFINMVCIRVDFFQITTFKELVNYVREKSLHAYQYGRYPFNRLVQKINPERDPSRNPIFPTIFQFINGAILNNEGVQVDLNVICGEWEEEITIQFIYNIDLFKPETIQRILQDYQTILNNVVSNPNIDIVQIELGAKYQKEESAFKEEIEFRF